MSWTIVNKVVEDENGNDVCILEDDLNPYYIKLIKRAPDIHSAMAEFVQTHGQRKKMSKKLFDKFNALLESDKNYDFKWALHQNGYIHDELAHLICFFPNGNTPDAGLIEKIPEILKTMQECVAGFNRNRPIQKPVYERFCRIWNDILEND